MSFALALVLLLFGALYQPSMGGPGEDSSTSDGACGASDSDVAAFVIRPLSCKLRQLLLEQRLVIDLRSFVLYIASRPERCTLQ